MTDHKNDTGAVRMPFTSLLIANRGEIAIRISRAIINSGNVTLIATRKPSTM